MVIVETEHNVAMRVATIHIADRQLSNVQLVILIIVHQTRVITNAAGLNLVAIHVLELWLLFANRALLAIAQYILVHFLQLLKKNNYNYHNV